MNFKSKLISLLFVLGIGQAAAQPFCIPSVHEQTMAQGSVQVASFTNVTYNDASLRTAAEYLGKAWKTPSGSPLKVENKNYLPSREGRGGSSIFLSLLSKKEAKKAKLGDEGYRLTISPKGITVQATTPKGALWGVQTLIQMKDTHFAKSNAGVITKGTLPCLTITDKPDYPIRGFMLDCGRKFYPLSYLYSLVNVMSYYKMNTLQLHLNDNGFMDQYENSWDDTYAAFRMESDYFPGLTAIDGSYSKQEMRNLIRYAETMGVEIIPEFDVPAHSLAFTHYRPSLAAKKYDDAHLDLENPELIPFLDSLYAEYLGGPDPVFPCPRFHIGTDEYSNKDSAICERFRELIVHLCNEVKKYGKQPVFWGSLTHAKGVTPVPSDGVLMSLWYNGYADPVEMHKQGFHMISIPDRFIYIVPAAGYYNDYLNTRWLFKNWNPSLIRDKRFDHQDPLIDGGMFALWNDFIKNGISVGDCHDRILPAMQVVSEKCWNALRDTTEAAFSEWQTLANKLEDGPLTDEIGRKSMVNHIDLKPRSPLFLLRGGGKDASLQNVSPRVGFEGVSQIGYPYTVEFDIDWADEKRGTVLLTSERSTFYLSDPIKGMLGFSRDGYLFTFKYKGKPGKRETIQLKGDNQGLSLFADGKLVERLKPDTGHRSDNKKSTYKIMRTLVFPLQETGDFRSRITNFSAWR